MKIKGTRGEICVHGCPQDHVEKCEKKPVECPNGCGEIIIQKEVGGLIPSKPQEVSFSFKSSLYASL